MITIIILYSKHALDKMDGLGVERSEVEKVIMQGMKWKEKNSEKWHASIAGVECVFLKNEDAIFIITVYEA